MSIYLLLNAGSSTLKCTLMEGDDHSVVASSLTDWAGGGTHYRYIGPDGRKHEEDVSWNGHAEAVHRTLHDFTSVEPIALPDRRALAGIGHRVVHGGKFTASTRITPDIREEISALIDLAPLHNPPSLAALAAAEKELPEVPQVAVFDTAFHATLPPEARIYPVPRQWTEEWGLRRFGFHGLSHAYCTRRAAEMLNRPVEELKLVICHLGNGCSAAAVQGGRSIDTTMGFTPLEGLMMGTRSGSIDPGMVLYIQRQHGLTAKELEAALNKESGLLGVSGISNDMRQVLAEVRAGNSQAQLAVAIYTHRVRQAIGAFAVTMGGIDAVVFTAGVGEHAAPVRESVCVGLECLGLHLDRDANHDCQPDAEISQPDSPGKILVINTREDEMMLQEVMQVLSNGV